MSRTRAGRKSWETRVEFINEVGNFAAALAEKEWKYDLATTKAMVIMRTAKADGRREVITFSQAYSELSMWEGRSFANNSEDGLSDMLCETFLQGAAVHTKKAEYRLWQPVH